MNFYQKFFLCTILLLACWIRVQGVNRLPTGQFTSNDAYLYAGQAEVIADLGILPDRDTRRWLPEGRDNKQILSLYAYAIAYGHKAISWMFPKLTLYHIQVYAPAICFILGLGVLCFFLVRTYEVVFASIVALLLATLPGSIERSTAGFGDRDAWCWMLGIFAVISYLWKERMESGRRRWIATILSGFIVFLGGLSWEGFGFFTLMILVVELWKFCSTNTEQYFKEYLLWLLMFVPWLYLISPVYRSGYGFSTHVAALMLFPPLVVLGLRGIRLLLLKHVEQLRLYPRKLAWALTLVSVAAGVSYILMQAGTFAETAYPFRESQLMQNVGELADPNFGYWTGRYGTVYALGSIGLVTVCLYLWKWGGTPLALSLSLFAGTTFLRDQVSEWLGSGICDVLFFVSLELIILSLGYACLRKKTTKDELVPLLVIAWFVLWVGLSRHGKRYDFFIGMPLAYGTAWLLWFSPVHFTQRFKNAKIVYPHIRDKSVATTIAIVVLIPVLFWTPLGGHANRSVYAATRMRVPFPEQNSIVEAFKWINVTLPKESVIAANWEYGNQLNVLGRVNTITDPDHFLPYWIHLYYRYVFCAQDEREGLEFLKTHKATHLMLTEEGVISRSQDYSSMGSKKNGDRQFRLYQLMQVEGPIGTPHRMQSRETYIPLKFIDIVRTSSDALSITAHFKDQNEAIAAGKLGETLTRDVTIERTVKTPDSQISVDLENGGLILDFDPETRLRRAYYIPSLGWNSLAVKLFLRDEHGNAFSPVYPKGVGATDEVKIWEIRYPSDIQTDVKYLATEPQKLGKE